MISNTLTAVAFAALAVAIPHSHQQFHKHQILVRTDKLALIAGRSESYDGSCGSWSGMACPAGSCCGPNGWCGTGADFCDAGCQSDFGDCGVSATPASVTSSVSVAVAVASSSASSDSLEVSPNGYCGPDHGYTCQGSNFGDSCSKWGYCGSNSSYSGDGCQSDYGTCGGSVSITSTYAAPSSVGSAFSSEARSTSASMPNKAPTHPTYGGYSHSTYYTTFETVTKTLSTSSPSTSSAGAVSSAPDETSVPTYSAPTSSTDAVPTTSVYSAPAYSSASPSTEPTSSSATLSSYSSAAPAPSTSSLSYIKMYTGDGSSSAGWPSQDSWLSAEQLWSANAAILSAGCDYFGVPNDSSDEIASLQKIVGEIASSSDIDERFIIAIMLQESNGCVRAPTTTYSISNPGLFQSHSGSGSCNNGDGVQNPCPDSEITQMVKDGVEGTSSGDGLKQLVAACAGKGAQTYYEAARMYNSGSVDSSGNLGRGVATHCYSSDIANRLTGWSEGVSGCDNTKVGA